MAVCTRHPFIQIFKASIGSKLDVQPLTCQMSQPILLMALDDYFTSPSQDCLARLFDAVNAMDLSAAPVLSRYEKIVMRCSERKDIFAEKFNARKEQPTTTNQQGVKTHRTSGSAGSYSSFEEGIVIRKRERGNELGSRESQKAWEVTPIPGQGRDKSGAESASTPSESSFPLGGEDGSTESSGTGTTAIARTKSTASAASGTLATGRGSTDASSSSSHHGRERNAGSSSWTGYSAGWTKDTHFYHTTINYKGHRLPIKMPLFTFPEEVGDVSTYSARRPIILIPYLLR